MKSKTLPQLQTEFLQILVDNKPAFLRMFDEDVIGIVSEVCNADVLTGKPLQGGPRYKMHGFGSSISYMVGKGVKGKKYAEAAGAAMRAFKEGIEPELRKKYPDAEIGAILLQDITVNEFLQHQAAKWFDANGAKVQCVCNID